jgi:outer membrane autotransporter protein
LSFGTGYDFSTGGFTFGPFARVNYIMVDIDGYREEIDNTDPGFGLVLEFESQDVESLTSVVGAQASYAISTGLGVLLPQVRFEWEHEFKDESRTITARFVADPTRTPIEYVTDNPDRDFFNVGVGLSAIFRVGLSAFVHYETVLGLEDVTVHDIVLGVRKEL